MNSIPTTKKPRKPFRHLLPHRLDVTKIVKYQNADTARWLVSTVLGKMVTKDLDASGFATLYSPILRRVMGSKYASQIDDLMNYGVLERSYYCTGKSYGYRLTDDYLSRRPKRMQVVNPVLRDRLLKEQEGIDAEQAGRRRPIHDLLEEAQKDLTILTKEAEHAVDQLPRNSRLCQRVHVDRLRRGSLAGQRQVCFFVRP